MNDSDYVKGVATSNFSSSGTVLCCFRLYGCGPIQLRTTGNKTKPWNSPKSITKENICKKMSTDFFKPLSVNYFNVL